MEATQDTSRKRKAELPPSRDQSFSVSEDGFFQCKLGEEEQEAVHHRYIEAAMNKVERISRLISLNESLGMAGRPWIIGLSTRQTTKSKRVRSITELDQILEEMKANPQTTCVHMDMVGGKDCAVPTPIFFARREDALRLSSKYHRKRAKESNRCKHGMEIHDVIQGLVLPILYKIFRVQNLADAPSLCYIHNSDAIKKNLDMNWEDLMLLLDPEGWLDYKLGRERFANAKRLRHDNFYRLGFF
jgi:uncharacterized protein YfcZ (UPF0381/DUF406 family)